MGRNEYDDDRKQTEVNVEDTKHSKSSKRRSRSKKQNRPIVSVSSSRHRLPPYEQMYDFYPQSQGIAPMLSPYGGYFGMEQDEMYGGMAAYGGYPQDVFYGNDLFYTGYPQNGNLNGYEST